MSVVAAGCFFLLILLWAVCVLSGGIAIWYRNKLNFLDISITKPKDKMSFDIYRKETTSDIIIPNDFCHPTEQKLAAIRYFTNRINTYNLDHKKKQAEENIVKQIVNNNKFNASVINKASGKKHKTG